MTTSSTTPDNNIDSLRELLFETLRGLKSGAIEVDRAQAISDLSQTIINTAKVEVEYARATGNKSASKFLPHAESPPAEPPPALTHRSAARPKVTEVAPGHRRYELLGGK